MLDTNLLLDWLLQRNPNQTKAIDEFIASSTELYISDVTLIELAYALEKFYELPRELVAENIQIVTLEPKMSCNDSVFRKATAHYVKHPALSFVDCYILYYAEAKHTLPVWTFDKKLINQSGKLAKSII